MFSDIIVPLLAFAFVLVLCYYTTKFVGSKFAGGRKHKTMKVVETLSLGLDRYLYLIQVGKKYFLFHSGRKGLELVTEIEMDEQVDDSKEMEESSNVFDFKRIFDIYSGLSQKPAVNGKTVKNTGDSEPEATGILKNIKRLQKINRNNE